MSENLFLRIIGEGLEWLLLDSASGVVRIRGKGSLDEFAEMTSDITWSGGVYVMLGGESVLLSGAKVPSKQRRQLLQAVPYMVEEQLATDVEDCHFAIGDRRADGEVSVAVVDKGWLKYWLSRLNGVGIDPDVVAVDVLMVPMASAATVMVDGQRILIRTGAFSGYSIERSLMTTAVSLLDERQRGDLTVLVHPDERDELQLQLSELQAEIAATPEITELDYAPFETLCRNFDRSTLNLLQGEFEIESQSRDSSGAWRTAAILAGCAFLLHLLLVAGQAVYLDIQARQYEAEAKALYNEVFPNDRNIRDMRRRWQAHLSGDSSGISGDFMALFKDTAKHLPGSNLVLNNVNYNAGRGDMILQLEASRSEQLVRFAQSLSELGLDADIGTISQEQDGVNGSIKVRSAGSAS